MVSRRVDSPSSTPLPHSTHPESPVHEHGNTQLAPLHFDDSKPSHSQEEQHDTSRASHSQEKQGATMAAPSYSTVQEDAANIYKYITEQAQRHRSPSPGEGPSNLVAAAGRLTLEGRTPQHHMQDDVSEYDPTETAQRLDGPISPQQTAELYQPPPGPPPKSTNPFRNHTHTSSAATTSEAAAAIDADDLFGDTAALANPWADTSSRLTPPTVATAQQTSQESSSHPTPASTPPISTEPAPRTSSTNAQTNTQPQIPKKVADVKSQRNQIYQIRQVSWKQRQIPVLTQNANGPCPLLALVNALVLTTPLGMSTALIETLQQREQVSLGLLLDAAFDELMSGRRGDAARLLPDVSELYSFLVTLHSGMNVNPRFVTASGASLIEELDMEQLGDFEATTDVKLYSTFGVPLIHGWLPASSDPAYAAFKRSASTFDEAQSFLFHEEELEAKLEHSSLSDDEQKIFMDLTAMKDFFAQWQTQLTESGLSTIKAQLAPGQVAILFRNDHFSTLLKDPISGRLLTLVTDAGYAGHDEIVWESLEDVSGTRSKMFSGDFRQVSHDSSAAHVPVSAPSSQAPTPASAEQRQETGVIGTDNSEAVARAMAVQEDADLALAMQLQEEEDQRRDRPAARPPIPERRSNVAQPPPISTSASSRTTSRHRNTEQDVPPPPTYEQAASTQPFLPPRSHPSSEYAPRREGRAESPVSASTNGSTPMTAAMNAAAAQQRRRLQRGRFSEGQQYPRSPLDPPYGSPLSSSAVSDRREGCLVM